MLRIRRGVPATTAIEDVAVPDGDGFRLEVEAFARLVRGDAETWIGATPEESLDIMHMIDAIRTSMMTGSWELAAA